MTNLEKATERTLLFLSIAFFIVSYAVGPITHYQEIGFTISFMAVGFVTLFAALAIMAVRRVQGKNSKLKGTDISSMENLSGLIA